MPLRPVRVGIPLGSYRVNGDSQIAHANTPDVPVVSRLQNVLPHRQSIVRSAVRVMDQKEINISEFERIAIMRGELLEGARHRVRNRGVISRHDFACWR